MLNARDLMNRDVVTVHPETPLREVAKVLLTHGISAVPVVKDDGTLIGMVSEGDVVGRKKTERETKSEWWLARLAEGETLNTDFLEHLQSPLAVAREVMSSPVLTVSEATRIDEIASLMGTHRVKRLPVVRDGRIVGIVRRADLLRTIGGGKFEPVSRPPEPGDRLARVADYLDHPPPVAAPAPAEAAAPRRRDDELTVADFRHLVSHHQSEIDRERARQRQIDEARRRGDMKRLIDEHISDQGWNGLIHRAREAAERGETEFLLLRFPSDLCSDNGRAINAPDPEWPQTLRGEAAEVYLRWERELRPRGFHIRARVLEFPGGVPGDVGMFLAW
jgi:CBS domain-containing protein